MRTRVILHLDFDSFFASVEQQYRLELRGKPLGVTAHNSRSCIIAASREAKKFGIKTGSRSFDAFQKCPSLILVAADFVKYFEVSKKFLSIAKDFSPYVELFSIDEVFIDATQTLPLFGSVDNIITKIKKRIREEIGEFITVSVGVSHNKLLAKLGSGWNKPDGVFKIDSSNVDEVYKTAQLTDICGIGERLRRRLNILGVYAFVELRAVPVQVLISEFGTVAGWHLKHLSLGIDDSEVIPYTEAPGVKSISRNYCLPENEYNMRKVFQNVYELCEEVAIKLRRLNKRSYTLGISLWGNTNIGVRRTFPASFDTGSTLYRLGLRLIHREHEFHSYDYVRQISVWVSNLVENSSSQLSLFSNTVKSENLTKTIDTLNERFGDHTIRNAFLLYSDKLTTVPNGYLADKYERTRLAEDSQF